MSKKTRCPACARKALKKNANFCTACGRSRFAVTKSVLAEADPAIREQTWQAAYGGLLTKEFKSGARF